MSNKVICLHSGGLDSTVLLYYLKSKFGEVLPISIEYGQRHQCELKAAAQVWVASELRGEMVDLRNLQVMLEGSSQTDSTVEVPDGHYSDETMKITVVPNRNMVLLSIATAYAISQKANIVAYGAHAGDRAIYPDCREVFIAALNQAINLCDYNPPRLFAPFSNRTKGDIVKLGAELGVPFHLTYSCYKGRDKHCGKCGTCVERQEAFYLARVADPTAYEDNTYWRTVTAGGNR